MTKTRTFFAVRKDAAVERRVKKKRKKFSQGENAQHAFAQHERVSRTPKRFASFAAGSSISHLWSSVRQS